MKFFNKLLQLTSIDDPSRIYSYDNGTDLYRRQNSSYAVDFYSLKELPGLENQTFVFKVIHKDGHNTGVVITIVPYTDMIECHGNDFNNLTRDDISILFNSIKLFFGLKQTI